jgi:uncharacterized protein (DUF924 family)
MIDLSAADVLKFWFQDTERSRWFKKDASFDRALEKRFGLLLTRAMNDDLDHWHETPLGSLALIIVLDQFSRNIHRDSSRSFESDPKALQLCLDGIGKGLDEELELEQRSFYYLPLRHAEDLAMQELGLVKTRELNDAGYGTDKYALNHLEIIRRFGRFPHRNHCLGRRNTAEEELYLKDGKAGF